MAVPGGEERKKDSIRFLFALWFYTPLVLALSNGRRFPRTYASKAVCRHGHPCDSYEPVLNRQEWRVKSAKWLPFPKSPKSLRALAQKAKHCKNCDLWRTGTQTVFGAGRSRAKIMMIGEQPGHEEDLQGKPFVGPAGRLFNRLLRESGIDRKKIYVTNAVKHFKWEPRGKRRIHKKPNAQEIAACRPWLDAEMAVVQPAVLVCLGATAARALLGKTFRVTRHRGEFVESSLAPYVMATLHPSAILRAPDEIERQEQEKRFVEDLKKIAKLRL